MIKAGKLIGLFPKKKKKTTEKKNIAQIRANEEVSRDVALQTDLEITFSSKPRGLVCSPFHAAQPAFCPLSQVILLSPAFTRSQLGYTCDLVAETNLNLNRPN